MWVSGAHRFFGDGQKSFYFEIRANFGSFFLSNQIVVKHIEKSPVQFTILHFVLLVGITCTGIRNMFFTFGQARGGFRKTPDRVFACVVVQRFHSQIARLCRITSVFQFVNRLRCSLANQPCPWVPRRAVATLTRKSRGCMGVIQEAAFLHGTSC